MYKLDVPAEQAGLGMRFDLAWWIGSALDVNGEGNPHASCGFGLGSIDILGQRPGAEHAAPAQAERNQPPVRMILPVAVKRLDIGDLEHLVIVLALCPAVGETGTDASVLERLDIALRIFAAADVMAPVVHGGHARIDRLGCR